MTDEPPKKRARHSLLDRYPELRKAYLQHLARFGSASAAASFIRCSTASVRAYMERNPQFSENVENAMDEHRGKIEAAIYTRGIEGWEEPRFGANGVVGAVRKFSDPLLLAYARRHIPEYREGSVNRTELQVNAQINHQHAVDLKQLSGAQREALRLLLGDSIKDAEIKTNDPPIHLLQDQPHQPGRAPLLPGSAGEPERQQGDADGVLGDD